MIEAPKSLDAPERELWRKLTDEYEFTDAGALSLLVVALEAHELQRTAWEQVKREGMTTPDGKPHVLLVAIRDSRKSFAGILRQLGVAEPEAKPMGRPVRPFGLTVAKAKALHE